MIARALQSVIEKMMFQGKVIILYGVRRTGKTTLVKKLIENNPEAKYINCDMLQNQDALNTTNSEFLIQFFGAQTNIVVLDEAQQINDIGMVLKILVDTFPHIQFIATGSSSFKLGKKVSEPLTGRSRMLQLYPFSYEEIAAHHDIVYANTQLERLMRFGSYPEIFGKPDQFCMEELTNIASNYLYKDILQFESLRRLDLLRDILRAVALQLGNEVSFNELAGLMGENVHTIRKYLELLERTFVIFRLPSLSRNLRNEIGKGQKIYFHDLGIRNALIQNFNSLSIRNDAGALWENYFIAERMKYLQNKRLFANQYFWRTYQQKEIDYIEESGGSLTAFECKLKVKSNFKPPKDFMDAYPGSTFNLISPENAWAYLISKTR
ncbi:MAG: ATP-binding protein [Bacteroidetes bacterium]|nr:ATP-binding protein [Bacteroidota bacterium]